jgi:DNA polymerase-1
LSIAFSNYDYTFVWPLHHRLATWTTDELRRIEATTAAAMEKTVCIAHHAKFEQEWLSFFYGDRIIFRVRWEDTMAQSYVLDEREGTKSLEACTVTRLGINVKSLSKVNAAMMGNEPLEVLLPYNGYDAKYTYLLFYTQQGLLADEGLEEVYEKTAARSGPLAVAQRLGVEPDPQAVLELSREYQDKVRKAEVAIQKDSDVQDFVKKAGRFNPASNPDLVELFHKQLGCKECEIKIRGGIPGALSGGSSVRLSTDESVLSRIDRPIAEKILELRGVKKSLSTYIKPFTPGGDAIWPDKLVHANFHHLRTSTTRLSCEDPNLQNFPIRKEKHIRRIIRAPKGFWLVAFDYGQLEARVIAMASKDKFLVNALWAGYDIHMEWAEKISRAYPAIVGGKKFFADKKVMKELRQVAKNKYVFPLFFGSGLDSVATDLEMPPRILSPIYDEFWDTFDGVRVWQEKLRKSYQRLGYVAKLGGGRRHGPMGLNELYNSPIQGTAADIVNDAFVRLSYRAYKEDKPHYQPRMQIHDDLSNYIPDTVVELATIEIAKEMVRVDCHDFINVPLTVEVAVGENWADKEMVDTYSSVELGHKRSAV